MEINRNNYELYMIDYLDAKLSAEQQEELTLFLAENTELQAEFDLLQNSILTDEVHPIPFEFKQELKKQERIQVSKYDELLVAKLEGDLSKDELLKLDAEIHIYPELKTSFEQYKKTKLIADEAIVFLNKSSLKKQANVIAMFTNLRMVSSIAAAFLIVLALWFFYSNRTGNNNMSSNNGTSDVNPKHEKPILVNADKSNKQVIPTKQNNVVSKIKEPKSVDPIIKVSNVERVNVSMANIETKEMSPKAVMLDPLIEKEIKTIQYAVKAKSNEANMLATNNYLTPQEYLQKMINANAQNTVVDQNKPKSSDDKNKNIGFALLGLFNKATGSDVKLVRRYDNDGNLTGYSVAANTLFANSR